MCRTKILGKAQYHGNHDVLVLSDRLDRHGRVCCLGHPFFDNDVKTLSASREETNHKITMQCLWLGKVFSRQQDMRLMVMLRPASRQWPRFDHRGEHPTPRDVRG